jgi:amino-acid N-acetyltransferase
MLRGAGVTAAELGDADAASIRGLLEANGLPTADLEHSRIRFLGYHDEKGLVGVVGLELLGEVGLLRSLAVRQDQRGSGLGTSLVREAEAIALEHSISELFLLTTTAEPFFAVRGYLRRMREGAPSAVQETSEFRSICPSSAAFMGKTLTPRAPNERNR